MSIGLKAARGAAWTVSAGLLTRALGVVGTLILTHLLAPEVIGEVTAATIVILTANQVSIIGFGQYVIARPQAGRAAVFHATVFNFLFAVVAITGVVAIGDLLAPLVGAPGMIEYLPLLAIGAFIDRVAFIPARLLARDMRFRTYALGKGAGELAYTGVSVGLAAGGMGGEAIAWGNVARFGLAAIIFLMAVDPREWLTPCRLEGERIRDLFGFGTPIAVASLAAFASRRWDSLLISSMYGPSQMGLYNLAYNLADIPASHVGEQIGDVLLPSFTRIPQAERPRVLVRSTATLALLLFPLAIGLGAVAPPLVDVLLGEAWHGVAPYLIVLSSLGLMRPIGVVVGCYLQAQNRPRALMNLQLLKMATLLGAVALFGLLGPVWASAGVGIGFVVQAGAGLAAIATSDRVPLAALGRALAEPLGACAVMVGAVLIARAASEAMGAPAAIGLALEILIGALVYGAAAMKLAPSRSRELLALTRRALRRRG